MNVGDAEFRFRLGGQGNEVMMRLLGIAMLATLPDAALEEVFTPLRNTFMTIYPSMPLFQADPVQVHMYPERIDPKTISILRRFQGR
jgi:hypothetical protein